MSFSKYLYFCNDFCSAAFTNFEYKRSCAVLFNSYTSDNDSTTTQEGNMAIC